MWPGLGAMALDGLLCSHLLLGIKYTFSTVCSITLGYTFPNVIYMDNTSSRIEWSLLEWAMDYLNKLMASVITDKEWQGY